jgi:transglutaminase-like putative cysteine protease
MVRRALLLSLVLCAMISACGKGVCAGGDQFLKDVSLKQLPAGCFVSKSVVASQAQTAAIAQKLGASISRLTNTILTVQGRAIQVNLVDAQTEADAVRIHQVLSQMKSDPALCLLKGKRVIEYVGDDPALARKTSYELGFVNKPKRIRYRITASVATVAKADYMSLNKLFNLFLAVENGTADDRTTSEIAQLCGYFQFGDAITLRAPGSKTTASEYSFSPAPDKTQKGEHGETATYSFRQPSHVLGVPYVTLTADMTADETGMTPCSRKVDQTLLGPTEWWPSDGPEIAALAKKITAGRQGVDSKVQAILQWLTPGKNIEFGGPVVGSRWGVKKVLAQKQGHCWDFSDCFVTLARAAGVPCRQAGGWYYGTSGHIWAEVLISGKGWRQVDPTDGGKLNCGIYHIPYFATETGEMPILYVSMPQVQIVDTD